MENKNVKSLKEIEAALQALKNSVQQNAKSIERNFGMITAIIYLLEKQKSVTHDDVIKIAQLLEKQSKRIPSAEGQE